MFILTKIILLRALLYEFFLTFHVQWEWNVRESELRFANKWELNYSQRFSKAGNEYEVVRMGGNGYSKVVPAHL